MDKIEFVKETINNLNENELKEVLLNLCNNTDVVDDLFEILSNKNLENKQMDHIEESIILKYSAFMPSFSDCLENKLDTKVDAKTINNDYILFLRFVPIWREKYLEKIKFYFTDAIKLMSGSCDEQYLNVKNIVDNYMLNLKYIVVVSEEEYFERILKLIKLEIIDEDDLKGFSINLLNAVKEYKIILHNSYKNI